MNKNRTFNEEARELREAYDALMAPIYKQVEKLLILILRFSNWILGKLL